LEVPESPLDSFVVISSILKSYKKPNAFGFLERLLLSHFDHFFERLLLSHFDHFFERLLLSHFDHFFEKCLEFLLAFF